MAHSFVDLLRYKIINYIIIGKYTIYDWYTDLPDEYYRCMSNTDNSVTDTIRVYQASPNEWRVNIGPIELADAYYRMFKVKPNDHLRFIKLSDAIDHINIFIIKLHSLKVFL
jgi:hypothetical protein